MGLGVVGEEAAGVRGQVPARSSDLPLTQGLPPWGPQSGGSEHQGEGEVVKSADALLMCKSYS